MERPKRYAMVIDLQLCIGCDTCSVACKQENNLPEGVRWTQVIRINLDGKLPDESAYPDLRMEHLPLGCQHCANGPCVEVCPTAATYRSALGFVMQDPSLCIGCRYCAIVCPFTGVRVFSTEQPTYATPFPTGDNPMVHRSKTIEKCTFCAHRLEQGKLPACIDACPLCARTFGDLNDPESDVARLLHERPHFRLLVEKGTEPSVFYLI
jgi:dimethyl sulfoxide reductase iron-sulfur subunit